MEIKTSKNLQRKMMRFDIELEEAVGRMASLGCIEECEEQQEEWTMNLSVAEDSHEVWAQVTRMIVKQQENKNVTSMCEESREKEVRLSLVDSWTELSVAEGSQDILAPKTRVLFEEWPEKDARLNFVDTRTELRVTEDSQEVFAPLRRMLCGEWPETDPRLGLADNVTKLSKVSKNRLYK